jgi:hypothetical protein
MGGHAFQARRPLDLEALTARLKPCPSTKVPIPRVFFATCEVVPSQDKDPIVLPRSLSKAVWT